MTIRKLIKWYLPLIILILISPWSGKLDLAISGSFFSEIEQSFADHYHHTLIYHYAVYPALILGIGSGVVFVLSFFSSKLHKLRFPCFFLAASMAIGAGFITHCVLKEFWFRPRPVQTSLFGGIQTYRAFYVPQFSFPNFCKSFPSGHATMGFYFINLILLGYRFKHKALKVIGITMTIIFSFLLGYSRIAQGAHFFSDILMSLVITWYAALIVERVTFDFLAKNERLSYTKD